ncbi:phosphoadenosine phosphosulfate reductase [Shewanella phage SFCi1]|nr:phosphoadenosine phosphosulfate reductase [Shewanella phage SFCi1]
MPRPLPGANGMIYDKNRAKFLLDSVLTGAMTSGATGGGAKHFIGLSGGKDSTACAAVAEYAGVEYTAFVCDTGHEKPVTLQYLDDLRKALSGEVVTLQKKTTLAEFERRRAYIREEWSQWRIPDLRSKARKALGVRQMQPPVPAPFIERACATLTPTGDAFLDVLLVHGTMPQKRGKFCSLELKTELAWGELIQPYLDGPHDGEDVVWWSGVRAEESVARQGLAVYEPCGMDESGYVFNFRPIYHLKHEDVFQIMQYMGLPWNPAYQLGDKRVGCNECFEANKSAIRNSFTRDPSGLDTIERWEREVAKVPRFAVQNGISHVPFFREAYRLERYGNWATAREVFEWSQTKRGSTEKSDLTITSCDSVYGLCG